MVTETFPRRVEHEHNERNDQRFGNAADECARKEQDRASAEPASEKQRRRPGKRPHLRQYALDPFNFDFFFDIARPHPVGDGHLRSPISDTVERLTDGDRFIRPLGDHRTPPSTMPCVGASSSRSYAAFRHRRSPREKETVRCEVIMTLAHAIKGRQFLADANSHPTSME